MPSSEGHEADASASSSQETDPTESVNGTERSPADFEQGISSVQPESEAQESNESGEEATEEQFDDFYFGDIEFGYDENDDCEFDCSRNFLRTSLIFIFVLVVFFMVLTMSSIVFVKHKGASAWTTHDNFRADVPRWEEILTRLDTETPEDSKSKMQKYLQECIDETEDSFYMNGNFLCNLAYMKSLRQGAPIKADLIKQNTRATKTGVTNGEMRLTLDNGLRGWWKTCSPSVSKEENYIGELIAFHLDRLAGFYRTPPMMIKKLTAEDFESLEEAGLEEDKDIGRKLDNVAWCSTDSDGGVEGSILAWVTNLVNVPQPEYLHHDNVNSTAYEELVLEFGSYATLTYSKKKAFIDNLRVTQHSSPQKIQKILENVALHMFMILTGTRRKLEHNVFVLTDEENRTGTGFGPFQYADNDRTNFHSSYCSEFIQPMRKACVFPRSIIEHLMSYNSWIYPKDGVDSLSDALGSILSTLSKTMDYTFVLSSGKKDVLERSIACILRAVQDCIAEHGEQNVLIQEPWKKDYVVKTGTWPKWAGG